MKSNTSVATHQDLALLFEPDVLAQDQFHAVLRASQASDPERRLMVAILEDAVSSLAKDPRRCARQQRKAFEEAHSWVNAQDSEDWVFSFTKVCETLGFDPGYLRRGLNRWSALNQSSAGTKPRLKKYRSGTRHRKLRFRSTM
jgi:hypothetical protein